MDARLIDFYAKPVPRYTSYPTAPHFSEEVGTTTYKSWLSAVPEEQGISLYIHIPYCDRLCWFCGCNTKQTRQYAPVARYLDDLRMEVEAVARALNGHGVVTALHFGGGSPTLLSPADLKSLDALLRTCFVFAPDAEISVEMDPNDMDEARYDALADIGLTRASLGVQDFDLRVQQAINRLQSFEQTREVVDAVRLRGARSVNTDLLYGLPHQTVDSVLATTEQILTLSPDRIALFGYAHVPWMKKHQTMIDESVLPDVQERFVQQTAAAERLVAAGYQPIGIDHFAKPQDSLAIAARERRLRRNFQGYTDDSALTLIGLGASSIGQFAEGYVQNTPGSGDYRARVSEDGFATVRGYRLRPEDRVRAHVIEKLMCGFGFSKSELFNRFGAQALPVIQDAGLLLATEPNGFFVSQGDEFVVPEVGRPFVRAIAAQFDSYLKAGKARHSIAV
ncbi:MAG TPA: oxygen-independent coproporphyrinogen III oxidase [Devosiaceae bacterium]